MINMLAMIILTIAIYLIFLKLQRVTKKSYLNPLLLSGLTLIITLIIFNINYESYEKGTEVITYLIGPATVTLAIPLYKNLDLLKKNWKIILITLFLGVLIHSSIVVILSLLLKVGNEMMATFLPKSVTTPIAISITESIGGIKNLTIGIVVLTGVIGATIAPLIFKIFKIDNPIARGLSLGNVAHAVGTSKAAELGEVEVCFSTISLIITGLMTVIMVPIIYNIVILIFG